MGHFFSHEGIVHPFCNSLNALPRRGNISPQRDCANFCEASAESRWSVGFLLHRDNDKIPLINTFKGDAKAPKGAKGVCYIPRAPTAHLHITSEGQYTKTPSISKPSKEMYQLVRSSSKTPKGRGVSDAAEWLAFHKCV